MAVNPEPVELANGVSPSASLARRYLEHVFGDDPGFVAMAAGFGGYFSATGDSYSFPEGTFQEEFYSWPDEAERIVERAMEYAHKADIYVCPLLRSKRSRKKGDGLPARMLFADLDELRPELAGFERLLVGPSGFVVDSGGPEGESRHIYLALAEALAPEEVERWNQRLAASLGADSGWSETKYLRLPGTLNHKGRARGGESRPVRFLPFEPAPKDWTLEELGELLPELPTFAGNGAAPITPAPVPDRVPRHIVERLREAPAGDRSAQMHGLIAACITWGLSDGETYSLALGHAPTTEKYGERAGAEIERSIAKVRPAHDHVGQPCDKAGCPNAPSWMQGARERQGTRTDLATSVHERTEVQRSDEKAAEPVEPFSGLTHDEVLVRDVKTSPCLVDDLVEAGTVGTVAGIPETHKSFLAQAIAVGVASGSGEILGHRVLTKGPVAYFWQDDSEANEVARIKLLEQARRNEPGLPLTWFLNLGLRLPDDLERVRATIEAGGYVLAVFDSFYNVAAGVSLRDEDAALVFAALKAEVCDRTGCGVLVVDHAPWPSDQNRGQRRAFGSVFKGAAIRWGIYVEREGSKLYVEARGNNLVGFKRTPAYWDADTLELRLVDVVEVDREALLETVFEYVCAHPGEATKKVSAGVGKRREIVKEALEELGRVERVFFKASQEMGRPGIGQYWFPLNDAGFEASQESGTRQDALDFATHASGEASEESPPLKGGRLTAGSLESGDAQHLRNPLDADPSKTPHAQEPASESRPPEALDAGTDNTAAGEAGS